VTVAHCLGLTPKWVDGTAVGGGSFMIHVRHVAAAIESGQCKTVLVTHAESGRSDIGRTRNVTAPTSLAGQFQQPYGPMGPPTLFTIPVLRYMKTYGLSHEQLAMVSVVQREWAAKNPRATFKTPITIEDVLNSRMIAYPFRLLQCCLVTDGGVALILVAAERARDFPQQPVYLLGTGESVETPMVSPLRHSCESRNPEPESFQRSHWTPAFAGVTKEALFARLPRRPRRGHCRGERHFGLNVGAS
jgi:acetyl-CoA acetyltransferase